MLARDQWPVGPESSAQQAVSGEDHADGTFGEGEGLAGFIGAKDETAEESSTFGSRHRVYRAGVQ